MGQTLKIGELAKQANCLVETVRYYEREGLLPSPARSDSNYRLYSNAHVERLQFIRQCRSLDMTLDEIRTLLQVRDTPESTCGEVNHLVDKHIKHVLMRIEQLNVLHAQLLVLRGQCSGEQAARDCGILNGLAVTDEADNAQLGVHRRSCH